MGISYNPSIVTEGLVLGLDPQSPRFYNYKGRSVAFDGNGDYLSVPATADFDLGSGKTYECWFKLDTISTNKFIGGSLSNHWLNIGYTAIGGEVNKVGLSVRDGSNWNAVNSTTNIAAGSWYHVAATWDGTNVKLYLNGVLEATSADWSAKTWASNNGYAYNIGGLFNDSTTSIDGVISNFRITDSVVYTSDFTPPTEPLTAVTNTKLLTCQGNTISDASSSAHSITPNGNVVIDYNGPFSGSGWTDLTNRGNSGTLTNGPVFIPGGPFNNSGGSVYFDGTGDYLSVPSNSDFSFGTGDFTIECFFYLSANTGDYRSFIGIPHSSGQVGFRFGNSDAYNSLLQAYIIGATAAQVYSINVSQSDLIGGWHHAAFTRSGTTCRIFLDGIQYNVGSGLNPVSFPNASFTDSTDITNNDIINIGRAASDLTLFNGFISNLRVVKGTALYTSDFTPPSSPLTAVTNTTLLCCQGGTNVDASPSAHSFQVIIGVPTLTSVGPSATKYFEFDGTDDYVISNDLDKASYGTTNFSLSLWFNADSGSYKSLFQIANSLDSHGPWIALISYSSGLRVYVNNDYRMDVPYTQDAWNNFVLTFDSSGSGLWTAYLNGSSVSTYTGPIGTNGGSATYLGHAYNNSYFDGKISNFSVQQKTLTASEVKQNYRNIKCRYGL